MSENAPTVRVKSTHPASQGAFVEINESDFDSAKHERYVAPPPAPAAPVVAPPPPAANPLANLPLNWRDGKSSDLRSLAERVTGRTADDKAQAIQMIEAALAAK